MFDLEEKYGYDKQLADEGAKKPLGVDPEEYIQLRHIPNSDYRARLGKMHRINAAALEAADQKAQDELSDAILAEVMADTCVTGWGKKFGVGGKAIPFSKENCMDLFIRYPKFRAECQGWAENHTNYKGLVEPSIKDVKKQ